MRRLLCLFGAVWAVLFLTAGSGTFPMPNRILTYTFQQGTDGYTGCEDTYLWSPTIGDYEWTNYSTSDSLVTASINCMIDGTDADSVRIAVIKFDITSLPDNFVPTAARLWLYKIGPQGSKIQEPIYVYRMLQNAGYDTLSWGQGAGCIDDGCKATGGITGYLWGNALADSATVPTSFWGADTLYNGETTHDRVSYPYSTLFWRNGNTVGKRNGWCTADMLKLVAGWHSGAYQNNGILLDMTDAVCDSPITFCSSEYPAATHADSLFLRHRRPKLVIQGYIVDADSVSIDSPATTATFSDSSYISTDGGLTYSWDATATITPTSTGTVTRRGIGAFPGIGRR